MKKSTKKINRFGAIKKKVLLLLASGFALGLAGQSITKHVRILNEAVKEWKEIDRQSLLLSLDSLYTAKLIKLIQNSDGTSTITLSKEGRRYVERFDIDKLLIKPQKEWDGKWRIVLFDVPEKYRKVRDALRFHFRKLGLVEYQKSVFIHPYPCEREIKYIVECYHTRHTVRFIIADAIDKDLTYRKKFDLG